MWRQVMPILALQLSEKYLPGHIVLELQRAGEPVHVQNEVIPPPLGNSSVPRNIGCTRVTPSLSFPDTPLGQPQ